MKARDLSVMEEDETRDEPIVGTQDIEKGAKKNKNI